MGLNLNDEVVETSPLLEADLFRSHGARSTSKSKKIASVLLLITGIAVSIVVFSSSSSSSTPTVAIGSGSLRAEGSEENGVSTDAPVVDSSIQVDVEDGTLQGARMTSRGGREYLEFRGIPYAKPPLGDLRFKPPQPADPWEGVRDATKSQPVCIQKRSSNPAPHGSEDCLYLNVFTPKNIMDLSGGGSHRRQQQRNQLPVIFYIHGGGGGAEGDGSRYSGDYFMDEDVVLVTIDYRLGVLGALNLNISAASGNQGLKDQVMGLKWVQANIAVFGGDKNRVTLVGNSAGAHQVSTHMLSPLSQPYVAGAIAQSGASILPGYLSGDPVMDGIDLGLKLNCSVTEAEATNVTRLLDCFRNISAPDLVLNSIHLRHWFTFTYSVDSASEPGDVFLSKLPLDRLQAGAGVVNRVPFMIGVTSAEGLPQALQVLLEPERAEAYNRVPWTDNARVIQDLQLQLSTAPEEGGRIAEEARQFYFDGGAKNVSQANIKTLSNMFSDRLFHHPIYITAQSQFFVNNGSSSTGTRSGRSRGGRGSANNNLGVYLYILSHRINVSRCQDSRFQVDTVWGIDDFGVCHADELQFFFPNGGKGGIYPEIDAGHEYEAFSKMVVKLWASFAAGGVPTGTTNNVTWAPINGTKPLQAMELNEEPKMVDFFPERMQFWDQFNLTDLYR